MAPAVVTVAGGQLTDPVRATPQYQAAMDLELWKRAEEDKFRIHLQRKEDTLMKALAEEWKGRELEREAIVRRKVQEYERLEVKLKTTLADLENREKTLALGEEELTRQHKQLQAEHAAKLTELRDASRRLEQDLVHECELERRRGKELLEQLQRATEDKLTAERRYRKLEDDFVKFRQAQATTPLTQLETQVHTLQMEKVELERKLEASHQSKQRYKAQWTRALQEVARLNQHEQEATRKRLENDKKELQHMRLRYLAREEKNLLGNERAEFELLKKELVRLKHRSESPASGTCDTRHCCAAANRPAEGTQQTQAQIHQPQMGLAQGVDKETLRRLMEERNTLLRTGVYSPDDIVIRELDSRIQQFL